MNRKDSLISAGCALLGMIYPIKSIAQDVLHKPNIIVILTDDQGSIDMNCYGATDLKTPNMDKLAATGIRFTQFYVGSAISSPSRACLLTGKTPQSAGLPNMASSQKGQDGMPTEQVTIAEMMKKAGYSTAHIGKWHLGYTEPTMPLAQGFDYTFGNMGGCIDNYSHFFYWQGPNRHDLWENGHEIFYDGKYYPDLLVEKADSFITSNKQGPFFLYFAFNNPHYPIQPTIKWRDYYKNLTMPRRDYAAFVSTVDERIGEIISVLDRLKIREKTMIILLSDQGHSFEERAFGGGGNAGSYRGGKFSLFEGGIRVPAIINWKGFIPEGIVNNELCMSMDILPTIADFCGIKDLPEGVEGESLKSVIMENLPSEHKIEYWQLGNQWAVRKDNWKLIGNPVDPGHPKSLDIEKDALFLINLTEDISESKNLRYKYPEKTKELLEVYKKWKFSSEKYIPKIY
jgi:arylsulfatase A